MMYMNVFNVVGITHNNVQWEFVGRVFASKPDDLGSNTNIHNVPWGWVTCLLCNYKIYIFSDIFRFGYRQ